MTVDEARKRAVELVTELSAHAGDFDGIRDVLDRSLDEYGVRGMELVCLAAVPVFARCLIPLPIDQAPPGALALTEPGGTPRD